VRAVNPGASARYNNVPVLVAASALSTRYERWSMIPVVLKNYRVVVKRGLCTGTYVVISVADPGLFGGFGSGSFGLDPDPRPQNRQLNFLV
jgi:hypothetical protein